MEVKESRSTSFVDQPLSFEALVALFPQLVVVSQPDFEVVTSGSTFVPQPDQSLSWDALLFSLISHCPPPAEAAPRE